MNKSKKQLLSLWLTDKKMRPRLEKEAKETGRSMNNLINYIVQKYFEWRDKKKG